MKYYLISILVAVGYLNLGYSQSPTTQADVWTPPRDAMSQLAPRITIEGFHLRPPLGYSLMRSDLPSSLPPGRKVVAWAGRPRANGTRPEVQLTIIPIPSSEARADNLDRILKAFIAAIQSRRSEWNQTPVERGSIAGNAFVRIRWDGVDSETGARMHGVLYSGIVGDKVVELASQDIEPYHAAALALAEASILTFSSE